MHARARERQLASLEGTSARESRLGTVISREKPGRNPGASRIMAEQTRERAEEGTRATHQHIADENGFWRDSQRCEPFMLAPNQDSELAVETASSRSLRLPKQ